MEHLRHFHLSDDPFRNEPDLRLFYEGGPHSQAWRRLDRGVRQSKGLSVLIGESGSGKTMVVRRLLEGLEDEVFEAVMMVVMRGAADTQALLTRFAGQLGVEDPPPERKALLGQIYEQLAIVREDGRHTVLIIDDAEALVSEGALVEFCGLLKLEYEGRRLMSLVLAGSPALDRALADEPELAHRIEVKVTLSPLDAEAGAAYLAHRVRAAGGDSALIEGEAVAALRTFGRGLPGRMNALADNALFEAFLCGHPRIGRVDVERAASDLGWGAEGASAAPAAASAPGANGSGPAPAREGALDDLDSELDAAFAATTGDVSVSETVRPQSAVPVASADVLADEGPPKDSDGEDELEDLLVELVED